MNRKFEAHYKKYFESMLKKFHNVFIFNFNFITFELLHILTR